jgi:hypothetical protein
MRRRRLLLGAGLLGLLRLGAVLTWLLVPRPGAGITRGNVERIREGMTEGEVEAVLGCPAGNYSGKKAEGLSAIPLLVESRFPYPPAERVWRLWVGEETAVLVAFEKRRAVWWRQESVADKSVPP